MFLVVVFISCTVEAFSNITSSELLAPETTSNITTSNFIKSSITSSTKPSRIPPVISSIILQQSTGLNSSHKNYSKQKPFQKTVSTESNETSSKTTSTGSNSRIVPPVVQMIAINKGLHNQVSGNDLRQGKNSNERLLNDIQNKLKRKNVNLMNKLRRGGGGLVNPIEELSNLNSFNIKENVKIPLRHRSGFTPPSFHEIGRYKKQGAYKRRRHEVGMTELGNYAPEKEEHMSSKSIFFVKSDSWEQPLASLPNEDKRLENYFQSYDEETQTPKPDSRQTNDIWKTHIVAKSSTTISVVMKNERKIERFMKFIKKNRAILHQFIDRKKEEKAEEGMSMMRVHHKKGKSVPKQQLDLSPARGINISQMRLKGRICNRNVMNYEGPKYNKKGGVYKSEFRPRKGHRDFAFTKKLKMILPSCCNCCKKSVLGCD